MNKHEEHYELTSTEEMLREIASSAHKSVSGYQIALGAILSILTFVLGVQCQGERLSATVIESKTRINNLETRFNDLQDKINWLVNNAATKDDVRGSNDTTRHRNDKVP